MKTLIVANWKMNPKTLKEAEGLLEAVKKEVKISKNLEVVICPPSVWLAKLNPGTKIKLGAQNCHWESQGAYTGEVSAAMLADAGVRYVILGHSERRKYLGETNEMINWKIKASLKAELKPILCVGEDQGQQIEQVVENQITEALTGVNINQLENLTIAYEPIWAIGPGDPCSTDNTLGAALFIRRILAKLYSRFISEKIPILYGGSVEAVNAVDYIKNARMNGLLIGGASLAVEEFVKIIQSVN